MSIHKKTLFIFYIFFTSCVSLNEPDKAPTITKEMSIEEAITIGVKFGGKSLAEVRERIKKQKEWSEAEPLLYRLIMNRKSSWPPSSLMNAVELYRLKRPKRLSEVFNNLVRDNRVVYRKLAWRLAGEFPSQEITKEINDYLTMLLSEGELRKAYLAEMASAVALNYMPEAYTVVREAFYEVGGIDFARAMLHMNPKKASEDFIVYLKRASVEELRQLNVESVNVYTCSLILHHYVQFPPSLSKELVETLISYSISRNNGFADMAREIIENYVIKDSRYIAFVLARMPTWVQLAFVERSYRQMTPVITRLLDELSMMSANRDVVDEIRSIRR